jgi:hypothetical protein
MFDHSIPNKSAEHERDLRVMFLELEDTIISVKVQNSPYVFLSPRELSVLESLLNVRSARRSGEQNVR